MNDILPFSTFTWASAQGRAVEMVCFAQFSFCLHLEGGLLVQIEADFDHEIAGKRIPCRFPVMESRLTQLLGATLLGATHEGEVLTLRFSNGQSVSISTAGPYEAVQITESGKRYVGW